ncbi:sensor histidine kinase [Methylosarcina fibrata]|uniref:sensor histidine kinase n=1 Tax=Methylosarcina fibrata TaxID=105972 RepID=UPI0003A012DF|nr:ATP-binding protein [Methylosarcina fibrata]
MKSPSYRPVQLRGLMFLGLLLLALAILGSMMWRNLHRFETVLSYVTYSHRIQNVSMSLQQSLIEYLSESVTAAYPEVLTRTIASLTHTMSQMDALTTDSDLLPARVRQSMATVRSMLSDVHNLDRIEKNSRLIGALKLMSETLDREALQQEKLLADISRDTETELSMATITFAVILLVAFLYFQRRILHPLNDLKTLLQRLSDENYTRITTDHLDPLLLPVFNSYNEMVNRLAELEEEKRVYAQSLQREVRIATQALLEQQASLARAERLAAIGEVAAELAHEIRNPLAGIQIAFSNLRREIDDNAQCERMEMIGSELKRLARLLNDMLDQSRHSPEASSMIDVAVLIRDLAALTRYQIAENLALEVDVPSSLPACLPESGLRQALLNLLLNAAEALEGQAGSIGIRARKNEHGVQIEIFDNGPGFSREMLEHGIRPFRTSRQRGTGLGLAMVQRFVKDLGGTVKLANRESRGAQVSLFLPAGCPTGNHS